MAGMHVGGESGIECEVRCRRSSEGVVGGGAKWAWESQRMSGGVASPSPRHRATSTRDGKDKHIVVVLCSGA